ncbi:MAG TPA: VWA domain-containing protein [bacterium]|nr:VWA domain-containing protein [bacterium]
MTFHWPSLLVGLLVIPILAWLYVRALRRPPQQAVRHTRVAAIAAAMQQQRRRWRRHIPAAMFGLSLAAVVIAMARPIAPFPIPATQNTVMLSIDVSRSMLADDLPPNRMEAAKGAATEFVEGLPGGLKVGLVTFSSYGTLIVPPTADHGRVVEAISQLHTEFATAIGDGLLEAVWALPGRERPLSSADQPQAPKPPVLPGTVVLLSDGQSNRGALPVDAARIARQQEVKVYTIGVGTPEGTFLNLGGRSIWVRLDEATLREMAEIGEGNYFLARNIGQLRDAYRQLSRMIGWESKPTEVTGVAAGVAALLALGAVGLSLFWVNRFS